MCTSFTDSRATAALALVLLACGPGFAGKENGELDIYWIDVEGGAATLIVTPAGESVLIDTGMPGERDPGRILKTVRDTARLERIDHLVITHFDIDHYGGAADLSKKIEIGRVYDPGLPDGNHRLMERLAPYIAATEKKRSVLRPGDSVPLREAPNSKDQGSGWLRLGCLAANQKFMAPRAGAAENPACADHQPREKDLSQNANSIVLLLRFGHFRFLDAGDLTWNLEKELVCPHDLVGEVDVYQSDHHGLDQSNNPVLVRTAKPTIAIINNGPRKGCEPKSFELLSKSTQAVYQVHRNVRAGSQGNTAPQRIANDDEDCKAEIIHLAVEGTARRYSVGIPSKGAKESYETKMGKQIHCQSNLKMFFSCGIVYWDKSGTGALPHSKDGSLASLQILADFKPDGLEPGMFLCPSHEGGEPILEGEDIVLAPETTSYEVVPWRLDTNAALLDDVIWMYDRESAHGGGRNVLFTHGAVSWMEEGAFQRALAENRQRFSKEAAPKEPANKTAEKTAD